MGVPGNGWFISSRNRLENGTLSPRCSQAPAQVPLWRQRHRLLCARSEWNMDVYMLQCRRPHMSVNVHRYVYIHRDTPMHIYIYMCIYLYVYISISICIYIYIHMCIFKYMYVYIYICICIHLHRCLYIYINICM